MTRELITIAGVSLTRYAGAHGVPMYQLDAATDGVAGDGYVKVSAITLWALAMAADEDARPASTPAAPATLELTDAITAALETFRSEARDFDGAAYGLANAENYSYNEAALYWLRCHADVMHAAYELAAAVLERVDR